MPGRIEYQAFIKSYDELVNKLITPVSILPVLTIDKALRDDLVEVEALWDTGAAVTCIKPALSASLKLQLFDATSHTMLAGIGGKIEARITLINLFLTPFLEIEFCPVYVADFPSSADILIGMDIIGMGDFVICNADNKTSFSFAIPPFPDRINLAEKAEIANG